jgi:dUTP pyrophosphatase
VRVKFVRLEWRLPELPLPSYATSGAAGMDLASAEDVELAPGRSAPVSTGLLIEIDEGFEGQVRPRSGLAAKHAVTVLNAPGTIDADYRGELKVLLINLGQEPYRIHSGDRIAQLVIAPIAHAHVEEVTRLSPSERGDRGFGHTGR